jgi:hypothetical protein
MHPPQGSTYCKGLPFTTQGCLQDSTDSRHQRVYSAFTDGQAYHHLIPR